MLFVMHRTHEVVVRMLFAIRMLFIVRMLFDCTHVVCLDNIVFDDVIASLC